MMFVQFLLRKALVAACCCCLSTALGDQVSTVVGSGADIEMVERNDPTASRINSADLNTRWNTTDRNEAVGLRFDLTGYTLSELTNVTLSVINYRTNSTRYIDIYGVTQGASGGTGTYDTETWTDTGGSAVQAWGDLPGLLVTDGTNTTISIDNANLTLLVDEFQITNLDEGSVESATSAALTSFVQSYTGSSLITLLLTQGDGHTSGGQFRFASKEAASLTTIVGTAGDFAPYLEFDVISSPPTGGLMITNTTLFGGNLVLSGTGGSHMASYAVLATNDLTQPVASWPAISTNDFDVNGNFAVTNPFSLGTPQQYFRLLSLGVLLPPDPGPVGFATVNGGITGGADGAEVMVTTASQLIAFATATQPYIINVSGDITITGGSGDSGGSLRIRSNKTLQGVDTNAIITGTLDLGSGGVTNVIIRNLNIRNPNGIGTGDGITCFGAKHVWIDHCSIFDCADGACDINNSSDYVTVSWCKFHYTDPQAAHRFTMISGNSTEPDPNVQRITLHHNWWAENCDQRMPSGSYNKVHMFNNYFSCTGNSYCSNGRVGSQMLSENNYYNTVKSPIYREAGGLMQTTGNTYVNCTGIAPDSGTNTLDAILSPPAYPYTLDTTANVPSIVTNGAGAGKGPFAP